MEDAPNIQRPLNGGRLLYDKAKRTIVGVIDPPPQDPGWEIPMPRHYLAIKYSAPPGTCKCGECQLVPPEMLMVWSAEILALRAEVKRLRVVKV